MGQVRHRLETPLGRARGLGAARRGVQSWKMLRLTALALVPLSLWFVISIIVHLGAPLETVRAWIAQPWNATLMILFVATGTYHGANGMTEIWEDYISAHWLKMTVDLATKALATLLAVAMIVSVLQIAVGS